MGFRHKERNTVQWHRIKSPEIKQFLLWIDFQQRSQDNSIQERLTFLFLTKERCRDKWISTGKTQSKETGTYITLDKNELKLDHRSTCKKQPLKFLKENIEETLHDLLDTTSKTWSIEEKISKLDFIKIKNFCSLSTTVERMSKQATDLEKILQITYLIKNGILPFATTWMDREGIMLSEVSQTKASTVWLHLYMQSKK